MNIKRSLSVTISILVLLAMVAFPSLGLSSAVVETDCDSGACFPRSFKSGGTEFKLRNTALYRFWGFRVYSAALYTQSDLSSVSEIFVIPFALSLSYHREISREQFIESSEKLLERSPRFRKLNTEAFGYALNQLYGMLESVRQGQSYTMIWKPEEGMSLYLDGVYKGSVGHKDVARLYLELWLSEHSVRPENFRRLTDGIN